MTLLTILLEGAAQQGSGISSLLMIVAMVVIFYFFMIRPQTKKQKEIKKAREAMTKGDRIITSGGVIGKVHKINEADNTMSIEVAPDVVIKVSRDSVYPAGPEAPVAEKK